jgi:hypothetical protein
MYIYSYSLTQNFDIHIDVRPRLESVTENDGRESGGKESVTSSSRSIANIGMHICIYVCMYVCMYRYMNLYIIVYISTLE